MQETNDIDGEVGRTRGQIKFQDLKHGVRRRQDNIMYLAA